PRGRRAGAHRLCREGDGRRQPRQHGGNAVSSREKPGARPGPHRQFSKVEAMTRKGYWIAMVSITDADQYKQYVAANAVAFEKFGAKFLARGGQAEFPEGFPAARTVIIE